MVSTHFSQLYIMFPNFVGSKYKRFTPLYTNSSSSSTSSLGLDALGSHFFMSYKEILSHLILLLTFRSFASTIVLIPQDLIIRLPGP